MSEQTVTSTAESRRSIGLWFGVLAGPAAWSLQILVGYSAEEIACSAGSQTETLVGVSIEAFILVLHIALTAVTVLAGLVSYRCWRATAHGDSSTGGRARWMALAGMMVSVLFAIVIVSGFLPTLFLDSCDPAL